MFFNDVVPQPVGKLESLVAGGALVRMLSPLVHCGLVNGQVVVLGEREAAVDALVPRGILVAAFKVLG